MDAIKYRGTTKWLAAKYKREADEAVKANEEQERERRAKEATARNTQLAMRAQRIADMWPHVKPGMAIGNIVVAKKNKFSIMSDMGNRYTIEELFGGDVARLIRGK